MSRGRQSKIEKGQKWTRIDINRKISMKRNVDIRNSKNYFQYEKLHPFTKMPSTIGISDRRRLQYPEEKIIGIGSDLKQTNLSKITIPLTNWTPQFEGCIRFKELGPSKTPF